MADSKKGEGHIITPEFRVGFPAIFTPQEAKKPGQQAKYTITMLFPKGDKELLAGLKKIAMAAINEKYPNKDKRPKLASPFGDGDTQDWDGFKGCVYVRAKSNYQPGIVGPDNQPIISAADFYGGCYARAQINAYMYDVEGNRGVAFGLSNVQKLRDGDPFGNRQKAEDVFEPVASDGDDVYDEDESAGEGDDKMFD